MAPCMQMGLRPDTAFGCVTDFLLAPSPAVRTKFAAEFQALSDAAALKIGIQARCCSLLALAAKIRHHRCGWVRRERQRHVCAIRRQSLMPFCNVRRDNTQGVQRSPTTLWVVDGRSRHDGSELRSHPPAPPSSASSPLIRQLPPHPPAPRPRKKKEKKKKKKKKKKGPSPQVRSDLGDFVMGDPEQDDMAGNADAARFSAWFDCAAQIEADMRVGAPCPCPVEYE